MQPRVRSAALAAVVTLVVVTVAVLLVAAVTNWIDGPLGIGTHQSSASAVEVVHLDGSHGSTVISGGSLSHWGPSWSPDGRSLVYTLDNPHTNVGQLVVSSTDGTGQRVITHDARNNYLGAWSRDGRRIAYISQQGRNTSTAELAVVNARGGNPRRLTSNHAWDYGASWSPDGRRIAFGSEQGGSWHVWITNADGTHAHLVTGTEAGNAPDWSPDGRTLAFTSDRTGNDNIYLVSAAGGTARRLTTGPCHSDNARWSPDGKRLVYAVFCGHGWNDIAVMNADGSHAVKVTNTPNREEEVPAWLPDGRRVGFTVFQVDRDPLWPGPTLRALLVGLILGVLAAGLILLLPATPTGSTT